MTDCATCDGMGWIDGTGEPCRMCGTFYTDALPAVDVLASEASRLAEWALTQKLPYEVYMAALGVQDVTSRIAGSTTRRTHGD